MRSSQVLGLLPRNPVSFGSEECFHLKGAKLGALKIMPRGSSLRERWNKPLNLSKSLTKIVAC